ncbi:hypothetical protein K504DRAFT_465921 [Pleomassaria siparia CBS 279.74]|uniref:Uncharacterized protein n=1 Tax=Pleomassaria siparia CBS 279.74 TaxID=1314801 RepID=A0A6G1KEB7_9PLEO|nr:hypothetical protein K504DRAFT_465921 [Pleomassaria siparia CBS 279.74]
MNAQRVQHACLYIKPDFTKYCTLTITILRMCCVCLFPVAVAVANHPRHATPHGGPTGYSPSPSPQPQPQPWSSLMNPFPSSPLTQEAKADPVQHHKRGTYI